MQKRIAAAATGLLAGAFALLTGAGAHAAPQHAGNTAAPAASNVVRTSAASGAARQARVVLDCRGQSRVRPSKLVLTCADANDQLTKLHWVHWGPKLAAGYGVEVVNNCKPNCAEGSFVSHNVLVTFYGSQAWKGGGHSPGASARYTKAMVYPGEVTHYSLPAPQR